MGDGIVRRGLDIAIAGAGPLIGPALAGHDLLGQAKTGTGKTAAFGIPILNNADPDGGPQALILAPTRELAVQIVNELNRLGKHTPIRAVPIVGGERFKGQLERNGKRQVASGFLRPRACGADGWRGVLCNGQRRGKQQGLD